MEKKQAPIVEKEAEQAEDVLAQYAAQTEGENDVHFTHVDGYYNDGSDCCC